MKNPISLTENVLVEDSDEYNGIHVNLFRGKVTIYIDSEKYSLEGSDCVPDNIHIYRR